MTVGYKEEHRKFVIRTHHYHRLVAVAEVAAWVQKLCFIQRLHENKAATILQRQFRNKF
jgi:hypothetical protein